MCGIFIYRTKRSCGPVQTAERSWGVHGIWKIISNFLHTKYRREKREIVTLFDCDQCAAQFVSTSSRNRHIKTVHERCGLHQLHRLPSQESSLDAEQDVEAVKREKKKTFYRCPFKTDKEGSACDFYLSKDDMKWKNSTMPMDHLQMYHFEQAQQETRIKWIKITA